MNARMNARLTAPLAAFSTSLLFALGGCQVANEPPRLQVTEAWVKAAPEGMTAVFGVIDNPGDTSVTIVAGSTPVASMVELHEVVDGVMGQKPGGFVLPANSDYLLEPGADHIMLMGLTEALLAGETITVTLETDAGQTVEFDADVRDFAAANEQYDPNHSGEKE